MQVANSSIRTAERILDMFDNIDQRVPWPLLKEKMSTFHKHRADFSPEAFEIMENIKTYVLNSIEEHFEAMRQIFEWCSLVVPLLTPYDQLSVHHTETTVKVQNNLLQKVINNGLAAMTKAQGNVVKMSENFILAYGKLVSLIGQCEIDNKKKNESFLSRWFSVFKSSKTSSAEYRKNIEIITDDLNERLSALQIGQAAIDISGLVIVPLQMLIRDLEQLKLRNTEAANVGVVSDDDQLRSDVAKAAQDLIGKCSERKQPILL